MEMHEDTVGKGRRAGNRWRREDNRGGAARVLEERELRQLLGGKKKIWEKVKDISKENF